MNDKKEIWRTYPEFNFIQGSNLGQVRTIDRWVMCGKHEQFVKGRVLKQQLDKDGYLRVGFMVNGKKVRRGVHRIVAQTFIPNPNNLPEVNHKDNDPASNCVSNLEWCTGKYNIEYREKYGKALNRPVIAINLTTLEVSRFRSQHEAGRELGVNQGHITEVIRGKRKKTGGYWFTNADNTAVEATRAKFGNDIANKVEELLKKK